MDAGPGREAVSGLFAACPEGFLLAAGDGSILAANAAAREAVGLPESLDGLTLEAAPGVRAVLEGREKSYQGPLRLSHPHKPPVPAQGSLWALPAAGERRFGVVFRETGNRRPEDELERRTAELEELSYAVSHDLRAPLRSIDGFSRILVEDYAAVLDDEGRDYLRRVREAGQNLTRLMDGLLLLSRVGRAEVRARSLDLSEVVQEICEELSERQPQREVEFTLQPGVIARADRRLIRIALENLLSNAFKFTANNPSASIEFGVSETAPATTYFVRDDGAGFDMAYEDKLFGAFQRLHRADEFEGSGIGLATVKRIVERHGGEIWAVGAVGRGATFFFTLGEEGPPKEKKGVRRWLNRSGS
jgi:light-regulated signal transduction histidine kinase (bacteriophytochrome)